MLQEEVQRVGFVNMSTAEKLVGSLALALLSWMAWTVNVTSTQVAVIESRMDSLTTDRYTGGDARRDNMLTSAALDRFNTRLNRLEGLHDNEIPKNKDN